MDSEKYLSLPSSWSKEQTCLLLEELEKHPTLYDQGHPLYIYKDHRMAAVAKIIKKLRPYKPKLTHRDVLNKIKSLRSQCCREKKYYAKALANGKKYKPKLWCYKEALFLEKKGVYNKNEDSSALPEESEGDEDIAEEHYVDKFNDPIDSFEEVEVETLTQRGNIGSENKGTYSVLHSKCLNLVECLSKEMKNINHDKGSVQQSPNTFLGLMVESELSKVTEEIYEDAKWKIIRILEDASKKNREVKLHPVQISLPVTSPSSLSNNPEGNKRVTVVFKTPQPFLFKPKNIT